MDDPMTVQEIQYNLPLPSTSGSPLEDTVNSRSILASVRRSSSGSSLAATQSFTWRQTMTIVSLGLVDFINFCSFSLMAPFFPKEAYKKGLSDIFSGLIFSFYPLMLLVSSPFLGKIFPKVGAKSLFLIGVSVAGISSILFGLLNNIQNITLFTTLCIIIRGVQALGSNVFSSASYMIVVNTFPDNSEMVLGILENLVSIGMGAGPAIGGILYSLGGFSLPFCLLGSTMLALVPLNVFILAQVQDCVLVERPKYMYRLLMVPTVVVTGIVVVVIASAWSFLNPTLEPHLRQFHLSPWMIGLIFLLISGMFGIFTPVWQKLAEKVNYHWFMMVIGLLMCTVGLLLLGPCPLLHFDDLGLWLHLTALSILGMSIALALMSTFAEMLISVMEFESRNAFSVHSFIIGLWTSMHFFGEAVGPFLGGLLLHFWGFPMASTVMATITFTAAVVALVFFSIRKSNSVDSESGTSPDQHSSDYWITSSSSEENEEQMPLLLPADDSSARPIVEYTRIPIIGKSTEDKRLRLLARSIQNR